MGTRWIVTSGMAVCMAVCAASGLLSGPASAQETGEEPAAADQPETTVEDLAGDDVDVSTIDQILRGDQEALEGEVFSYDPAGRRDPFRSLLEGVEGPEREEEKRPPGLPGTLIEELTLQGIIQTPDGIVAVVQGRENTAELLRPGTQLYNGEVVEILPQKVVFRQQVNDPKQLRTYQEVVRELAE